MKVLVTGTAGFIGFHFALKLASQNYEVVGIDNINDYYDVRLKLARLKESGFGVDSLSETLITSEIYPNYRFAKIDITDLKAYASCSKPKNLIRSYIWQHRRAFATRWKIRRRISIRIS